MEWFRKLKANIFGYQPEDELFFSLAIKEYGQAKLELVSVYDGDTFRANIDGFPPIIGDNIPIRIAGIDCPELTDPRTRINFLAVQAKMFTEDKLKSANEVIVHKMRREKYFRILGDVFVDGKDLGQMLLNEGLAKPYAGGKKLSW